MLTIDLEDIDGGFLARAHPGWILGHHLYLITSPEIVFLVNISACPASACPVVVEDHKSTRLQPDIRARNLSPHREEQWHIDPIHYNSIWQQ